MEYEVSGDESTLDPEPDKSELPDEKVISPDINETKEIIELKITPPTIKSIVQNIEPQNQQNTPAQTKCKIRLQLTSTLGRNKLSE